MRLLPFLAILSLSAAASATEVIRLSAAERDAVLDAAAAGPEKSPVLTPLLTPEQAQRSSVLDRSLYPEFYADNGGPDGQDRKVHGEVTMFAGSGGTFGMSGTAILPVGATGTALVSITQGTSRLGGIQGFSLGYASGDAQNSLAVSGGLNSFGGGYDIGLGGYGYGPGFWGSPYGYSRIGAPPRRHRRR